jgi:hypothetical protein
MAATNDDRKDRLSAALRENLKRRKQQVKGRAVQGGAAGGPQGAPEDVADEEATLQDRDRPEQD